LECKIKHFIGRQADKPVLFFSRLKKACPVLWRTGLKQAAKAALKNIKQDEKLYKSIV
jgi:hypothetical protein